MYSIAAWGFIAGAAGLAAYLWERPTMARGDVLANEVAATTQLQPGERLTCDAEVPLGLTGAAFRCEGVSARRERIQLACTLDRDGAVACRTARR